MSLETKSTKYNDKHLWCYILKDHNVQQPIFKPIISARDISVILGLNPFTTRDELLKEKAGIKKKIVTFTDDIKRGIRLEAVALEQFASHCNIDWRVVSNNDSLKSSQESFITKGKCQKINCDNYILSGCADGVISPNNIIVEVKCPKRVSKKVPVYYYTQIQLYMFLYNSFNSYYVEYIENRPLNIIEVPYNEKFIRSVMCHIDLFVKDVINERIKNNNNSSMTNKKF